MTKVEVTAVSKHFDERAAYWDQRYDHPQDIADYELVRRRELTLAGLAKYMPAPGMVITEVGCGSGRVIADVIQAHEDWRGIGIDISGEMIAFCQRRYQTVDRLAFVHHDLNDSPIAPPVDAVLALGVIGYMPVPVRAFDHIYAMLKPGGYFFFTFNKPSLPRILTEAYRSLRSGFKYTPETSNLNKVLTLHDVTTWLGDRFTVLESHDYSYLPYIPVIRRAVWVSRAIEQLLGSRPTRFSRTTLFIAQKLDS